MLSPVVSIEPDVFGVDSASQRVGDLLLPMRRRVASSRRRRNRRSRRTSASVPARSDRDWCGTGCRTARPTGPARSPPPTSPSARRRPLLVFDEDLVGVFGVGRQPGHPAMIGHFGLRDRRPCAPRRVVDLDARRARTAPTSRRSNPCAADARTSGRCRRRSSICRWSWCGNRRRPRR